MIDRYTQLQLVLKSLKISTKIGREVSKCKKFPEFADQDLKPECVSFKIIGFFREIYKNPSMFHGKKRQRRLNSQGRSGAGSSGSSGSSRASDWRLGGVDVSV
jgi:hypothetical protein